MGDLWDLWFLIIPGILVAFVVAVILNSIFNIKKPTDGRPIVRAPAGAYGSADSSWSAPIDLSTYPGAENSHHAGSDSSSDTDTGGSDGGDGGSSGGGDGGGGGGGD